MDFSLVIPFYNEEENVEIVIKDITSALIKNQIDFELIAVNNNSTDNTEKIIKTLAQDPKYRIKYVFEERKGYGNAIRRGLASTQGKWIGWTDGDNQIDSEDVLKVMIKTKETNAILCKAERRIREDGLLRKFITFNYRLFISAFLRKWTYDVNGKPKFFLKAWYDQITTESNGWFIDAELMFEFLRRGAKVINVPITFHQRKKGKSSVSFKSLMRVVKEFFHFLFHSYFKKRIIISPVA